MEGKLYRACGCSLLCKLVALQSDFLHLMQFWVLTITVSSQTWCGFRFFGVFNDGLLTDNLTQ